MNARSCGDARRRRLYLPMPMQSMHCSAWGADPGGFRLFVTNTPLSAAAVKLARSSGANDADRLQLAVELLEHKVPSTFGVSTDLRLRESLSASARRSSCRAVGRPALVSHSAPGASLEPWSLISTHASDCADGYACNVETGRCLQL
jgi:hypothetical protein